MQWFAVVVVVAATVFGHVNGRAASGALVTAEINNEVTLECPHKAVPNTIFTVPFVMLNKLHDCIKPSATFNRQLGTATNREAYRRLFRSACSQEPAVRSCIAAVTADTESCLSAEERQLWSTVVDFLDSCITGTCADGSEVMAAIFGDEFKAMTMGNQMRVLSCMYATTAKTLFDREADLPAYTYRKYTALKSGRDCILNVAKHGQTSSNQFELFMDKRIKSIKCLTPETNEIVPCESLDTAAVLTSLMSNISKELNE